METIELTRKELYDLVWNEPMTSIAKRYKISDVGLRKICIRMEIPLPKAGYWAKKQYGKKVIVKPLKQNSNVNDKVRLTLNETQGDNLFRDSPLKIKQNEIETDIGIKLKVPERLYNPDPLITNFNENLIHRKKYHGGYFWTYGDHLSINVEGNQLNRAILIMDTFIKAIKLRGHYIKIGDRGTFIIINEVELKVRMLERKKRIANPNKVSWPTYEYIPTGILVFKLDDYHGREWYDGKVLLENQLSKILASLELVGDLIKVEREQIRKSWEKYERQKQIEHEITQRKLKELNEFKVLLNDANRWKQLLILREYINFMESKSDLHSQKNKDWLKWAKDKADWYDPSINLYDELMNEVDKNTLECNFKNHN